MRRLPSAWENIFADVSDEGLISKIYKEFIKLNKKKDRLIKNWAMGGPAEILSHFLSCYKI